MKQLSLGIKHWSGGANEKSTVYNIWKDVSWESCFSNDTKSLKLLKK
jgi:hypothetical protein